MQISQFFINGDIKGAIAYMRQHEEFKDILPEYIALFENCQYRKYEIADILNDILRLYQIYYHEVFYCGTPEETAANQLLTQLKELLQLPNANEDMLVEKLKSTFKDNGYHSHFGKTQGYYGPYVWKDTVETVYKVELFDVIADFKVNILKGFVFRSWMDYLTFGRFGTRGWATPDGTINCIEQAYDFESESFLISLLKHEAQHTLDMKKYPHISEAELEYRAKLVELHYSSNPALLQKFLSEANENKINNGHALASARLKNEFSNLNQTDLQAIQTKALQLFQTSNKEMDEKYLPH
ncbi:MAG: hypothetical protein ACI4WG_05685 [Erysipelotrichaceae bacterium]